MIEVIAFLPSECCENGFMGFEEEVNGDLFWTGLVLGLLSGLS